MTTMTGRMYLYLWEDTDDHNECKFGERWVFVGQDPEEQCRKRIRESIGVRKDRYSDGKIRLVSIWDASAWAEEIGRNHSGGRMDDYVRALVGFRKGSTGEVHTLPGDEMAYRVNEQFKKHAQPLPEVKLTTAQYHTADDVIQAKNNGKRIILAELAARFGKTIWAGVLAKETEQELVVVASYVLTSFASFMKDLSSFKQFADFILVDTSDSDYENKIQAGIQSGRTVVAFLSLCNGNKRQDRIDYMYSLHVRRLAIVDEADFGAHKTNQALPLINAIGTDDTVVLMTGTDSDRAAGEWRPDYFISYTYPELLMDKERALTG